MSRKGETSSVGRALQDHSLKVVDAIRLGCSSSIKLLCNCAQKKESAFTELGLTPEHDRFIACFSPLQTKACCAAEEVWATSLPHPWVGSEQGSAHSHENHRFRHFLDHSNPSVGDEILDCHTAVKVRDSGDNNQHKPSLYKAHSLKGSSRYKLITLRPPPPQHLATSM